ncbi:AbrB/MazE/SpoVT family DNA-binding domain-containing protein [Candidatus Bathyarchaeota archaeon]|nr:AbrB/MazE/SpoVT family DNA-binding domain-containing protein [Candidatus Bathyarchaeota archaeon]
MPLSKVDQRHRVVIDKQIRMRVNIKAGDTVLLEPLDDHSFKATVINLTPKNVEDDPAWKATHTPVKVKGYIPPERLEEIVEEEVWLE